MTSPTPPSTLSPLPIRLAAYVVLIAVALAAIALIDQRAMQRMNAPLDATPGQSVSR